MSLIVYRDQKPRLGGHEKAADYAPVNYRPGPMGRRVIAHVQAQADKRRAERTERRRNAVAQRLAEIQAAEAARQNKRRR
jgi:hypothetical protein